MISHIKSVNVSQYTIIYYLFKIEKCNGPFDLGRGSRGEGCDDDDNLSVTRPSLTYVSAT